MLTIALNEYGDFHHLGQKENSLKHIHFITGIVYDDEGSEQDLRNEQIRLDRFFRAVAEASIVIIRRASLVILKWTMWRGLLKQGVAFKINHR